MGEEKGLVRAPGRITQDQYTFLEEQVSQGRFGSVSETVRAAIDRFAELLQLCFCRLFLTEKLAKEPRAGAHDLAQLSQTIDAG